MDTGALKATNIGRYKQENIHSIMKREKQNYVTKIRKSEYEMPLKGG
jgi:chemotaxis methyl-accepting protein methylase